MGNKLKRSSTQHLEEGVLSAEELARRSPDNKSVIQNIKPSLQHLPNAHGMSSIYDTLSQEVVSFRAQDHCQLSTRVETSLRVAVGLSPFFQKLSPGGHWLS